MTWIKTIPLGEADAKLRARWKRSARSTRLSDANPVHPRPMAARARSSPPPASSPTRLHHAFATFGVLMSPELPLTRRQHEMITTMVSVTNRCVY